MHKLYDGMFIMTRALEDHTRPFMGKSTRYLKVPIIVDFSRFENIPADILTRKHVVHNPIHTHVRANYGEMYEVGRFIAERLARSTGPAEVLIPTRGFTQLNVKGGPMYDPESDKGFLHGLLRELKRTNARNVTVEEFYIL